TCNPPAPFPSLFPSTPPFRSGIVQLRNPRTFRLELWESDVPAVQTVVRQARLAATSNVPVLLQGPRGSGKEWLARTIHRLGPRRDRKSTRLNSSHLGISYAVF